MAAPRATVSIQLSVEDYAKLVKANGGNEKGLAAYCRDAALAKASTVK